MAKIMLMLEIDGISRCYIKNVVDESIDDTNKLIGVTFDMLQYLIGDKIESETSNNVNC